MHFPANIANHTLHQTHGARFLLWLSLMAVFHLARCFNIKKVHSFKTVAEL